MPLGCTLTESRTRSNVVDVLSNVSWNVVLLGRDVMGSRDVFPDEELSDE